MSDIVFNDNHYNTNKQATNYIINGTFMNIPVRSKNMFVHWEQCSPTFEPGHIFYISKMLQKVPEMMILSHFTRKFALSMKSNTILLSEWQPVFYTYLR